jgi:hypothetical protein
VITLSRNVDLAPKIQGWETAAANAFDTALFTANFTAAFSVTGGSKFSALSPFDLCKSVGTKFCCDQSVLFVPRINSYLWVLLADDGPIVIAVASPQELRDSEGLEWSVYRLDATIFRQQGDLFDYPDVTFGDNFVYLTANFINSGGALMARIPIADLSERRPLNLRYAHIKDSSYICPAQLTGSCGRFGTMHDASTLRLFSWKESSLSIFHTDVPISTVPTENWRSITPDGDDWLPPSSKISIDVTGAAVAGQELWLAWSAARKVPDKRQNSFAHPNVQLAVIDIVTMKLIRQEFIWNPDYAFAWPFLAANPAQQIAISLAGGGGTKYPQQAVGILRPRRDLAWTTSGKSVGSGGHFMRVRLSWPLVDDFVAGGYTSLKDTSGILDHPHYVVFRL